MTPRTPEGGTSAPARVRRRLLWVNATAVAPDSGGGTRHHELSRELLSLGWDVTVVASDFNFQSRRYTRRESADDRRVIAETIDGVAFRWLWSAPYQANDARRVLNWLTFAWSLLTDRGAPDADVIIGSSPHPFAAFGAWLLALRRRTPFVFEVRDLWPESLAVGGHRGPVYWVLWLVVQPLYRAARRIVVLAQGTADYLERKGVSASRIVLVPNGVALTDFGSVTPTARDTLRLVYAGAHGPANGLDAVLDAADRLRDEPRVRFVFVGDGPDKERLRRAASDRALQRVEFLAPVPKSRMPALLGSCDAGLMVLRDLPLFRFGVSPNKLFDYWGAGLPVVNNVGGEVAGLVDAASGGVSATDASGAALAAAIARLLAMPPASRAAMGTQGREWTRTHRDRPVVARALASMLGEVAGA